MVGNTRLKEIYLSFVFSNLYIVNLVLCPFMKGLPLPEGPTNIMAKKTKRKNLSQIY